VINRQQPRQFAPFLAVRATFPILEPSPLALSHSLDALCFKSVHQPVSNQPLPHSFIKMPGCMGFLPCDLRFDVQTCERSNGFPTYLTSFHTLAHSFALNKNSTPLFSNVSALFAKNHPGWGYPAANLAQLTRISRTLRTAFSYLWMGPKAALLTILKRALPVLIRRPPEQQLWIVEPDRIRFERIDKARERGA
jgi:hypothetical protein